MPQRANSERLSMMEPISRGRILTTVKGLLIFALVALLFMLLALAWIQRQWLRPSPALERERIFRIEAGTPLARLSRELHEEGIIPNPRLFSAVAQLQGLDQSIRHGEYSLPAGASPADLLRLFVAGRTRQHRVTLIEGWTFAQALAEIQSGEGIAPRLLGMTPGEVARAMNLDLASPEGMIFPDTYFYAAGDTDLQLLLRANARLHEILDREWRSRDAELPLDSPYQALILASIVEKEASNRDELGLIAGVFLRRLHLNMRLQSDPTVIYGLGERFDGDLRGADLAQTTAFNTYRIDGLPPTPIALAGLDSIRASLQPTASEYLYFVGMNNGDHYFSRTLAEHNAAVDCYQRRRETANCALPQN